MSGCTHHCRSCESHFSSLLAFDLHQPRPGGKCEWPEGIDLVEKKGDCKIGYPDFPQTNITIYELEATQAYREMRSGQQD